MTAASEHEIEETDEMNMRDRAAFLGGIENIAGNNLRHPETYAAFLAVAETLADNFGSAAQACDALKLVILYGQAIAGEAYDNARAAVGRSAPDGPPAARYRPGHTPPQIHARPLATCGRSPPL